MGKGGKVFETRAQFPSSGKREAGTVAHPQPVVPHSGSGRDRAQATAHRRMTGEGRSAVTGICQELPMMLLGVQSSLRGKVTPEVFLEACRFS